MEYKEYLKANNIIIEIISNEVSILRVNFIKEEGISSQHAPAILNKAKSQLLEYLNGTCKNFDFNINPNGTPFQLKVWNELLKIPYGETMAYSDIAQKIGGEKMARAVGSACNKNPCPIFIPCHRVIGKNKKLTGYAYGLDIKEFLISLELKYFKKKLKSVAKF